MVKDLSRMDSSCDKTKAKQSIIFCDGKVFQICMNDGENSKVHRPCLCQFRIERFTLEHFKQGQTVHRCLLIRAFYGVGWQFD